MRLTLPLLTGARSGYPSKPLCPVCREKKVFEPNSFVAIETGALKVNRRTDTGGPSPSLDGFFTLIWHGAHDGGHGGDSETFVVLPIAESVIGGQSPIYLCSTTCLAQFFATIVKSLEARIKAASRQPRRKRSKARPAKSA